MSERRRDRHLVRVTIHGERRRIGSCSTEAEAEELRAEVYARAGDAASPTLAAFGAAWLDERERDGVRGIRTDRGRWRTHIADSTLAAMPLVMITSEHAAAWIKDLRRKQTATPYRAPKPLEPATIAHAIGLLSQVFDAAMPKHISINPLAALKREIRAATKRRGAAAVTEAWTYLEPDEQERLRFSEVIPDADRLILLYALLTGVRQGEQFHQELADVHLDAPEPYIYVRFGSKGKPPKNGRARRVYLSAEAVDVCRRWLAILPSYAPSNPERLLFPGPSGGRMSVGKTPLIRSETVTLPSGRRKARKVDHLERHLRAIGVTRAFRWHDLRHSCASSLVAGWWGRRWTLEEVREHLGHTSIASTQRYAHLGDTAIKGAVRATPGWAPRLPTLPSKPDEESAVTSRNHSVGRQGLEPWTYGLKAPSDPESSPNVVPQDGREGGRALALAASPRAALLAQLTEAVRVAVEAGDLEAARIANEAIARLLGSPAPGEPAPVVDINTARRGAR